MKHIISVYIHGTVRNLLVDGECEFDSNSPVPQADNLYDCCLDSIIDLATEEEFIDLFDIQTLEGIKTLYIEKCRLDMITS